MLLLLFLFLLIDHKNDETTGLVAYSWLLLAAYLILLTSQLGGASKMVIADDEVVRGLFGNRGTIRNGHQGPTDPFMPHIFARRAEEYK